MFTRIANFENKNEIIEAEKLIGAMNTAKLFEVSALDVYLICCEGLGIHPKTHENIKKDNNPSPKYEKNSKYSEDFKIEVTAYAQKTTVSTASRLYKVSIYSIKKWMKERNLEDFSKGAHYSKAFKDKVTAYAAETTISDASRKFDINYVTIRNWCKETNVDVKVNSYRRLSEEKRAAILQDLADLPTREIIKKHGVSRHMIEQVRVEADIPARGIQTYSAKRVTEIKEYVKTHSVKDTAKYFNISQASIYYILRYYA